MSLFIFETAANSPRYQKPFSFFFCGGREGGRVGGEDEVSEDGSVSSKDGDMKGPPEDEEWEDEEGTVSYAAVWRKLLFYADFFSFLLQ